MRTLPDVVRRGAIFHFRRVVPKDIRGRIGRTELVRSLETSDIPSAKHGQYGDTAGTVATSRHRHDDSAAALETSIVTQADRAAFF